MEPLVTITISRGYNGSFSVYNWLPDNDHGLINKTMCAIK